MAKEVFATTEKVTVTRTLITTPPALDKVRVYAKNGSFLDVFPVDAKEIVAQGEYEYEPVSAPSASEDTSPDFESMTKADLEAYAEKHGIQLMPGMLKAEQIAAIRAGGE